MRISRHKAWEILSNHSIVILGQGNESMKELKDIIQSVKNVIPNMVTKRSIYPLLDDDEIRWSDGNTILYDNLLECMLEKGNLLYFSEYSGSRIRWIAVYIINLHASDDTADINVGNLIQLMIDVMGIGDDPDSILDLNRYIEDRGVEEALTNIVKTFCDHII